MSTNNSNHNKTYDRSLIGCILYGLVFVWFIGFAESLDFIKCDVHIIANQDKLIVLIIASMTVAATLLTTRPTDDRVKQFSFLMIAIIGVAAAAFAIEVLSWGLLVFVVLGLVPTVAGFLVVAWYMFEGFRWQLGLLFGGAALVWVAAFLLNSKLGADLSTQVGDRTFFVAVVAAAIIGHIAAFSGVIWDWWYRKLNSRASVGSSRNNR